MKSNVEAWMGVYTDHDSNTRHDRHADLLPQEEGADNDLKDCRPSHTYNLMKTAVYRKIMRRLN